MDEIVTSGASAILLGVAIFAFYKYRGSLSNVVECTLANQKTTGIKGNVILSKPVNPLKIFFMLIYFQLDDYTALDGPFKMVLGQ